MIRKRFIGIALLLLAQQTYSLAQANPVVKITEAFRLIQEKYVDEVDDQKLADAAIEGMMTALDPHCRYFTTTATEGFDNAMSGKFYGIGIQFLMEDDSVFVSDVLPDGPAELAGLNAGDRIVRIDTTAVAGKHLGNRDIYNKLRGGNGQPVTLTIIRKGSPSQLVFQLKRGTIPDHSVTSYYMLNDSIGYLAIGIFNRNTRTELDAALDTLKHQRMKSLILDLQDNGGGAVESAIGTADEFLNGEKMVFYSVPREGGKDYFYTAGLGKFMEGRLVVLINQSTASASEIATAALQDWDRALIVGRRSFGKGLTQKAYALPDGSTLDITNTRYYTPTGRWLQKSFAKGIPAYNNETNERLADGELYDSSKMPIIDSLVFQTLVTHRKVYGNVGIIPDVYVPLDSLQLNAWYALVGQSNIEGKLAFELVNRHQQQLLKSYPSFSAFKNQFNIPDSLWSMLTQTYPLPSQQKNSSRLKTLVNIDIKAMMAKLLYHKHSYSVEIANTSNPSYEKAIELLEHPRTYDNILRIK